MTKKRLAVIVAIFCLIVNTSKTFAAANPFSDVPTGHWAYNAVITLASKGIIEGYGEGTFRGNRNITRYEAATITAQLMATSSIIPNLGKVVPFDDVPQNHWAYNSVKFTYDTKINNGYEDHTFRGNRNITRYEMAQMFAKVLKSQKNLSKSNTNPFSDVNSSHWAINAIIALVNEGIIEGYGDGTYRGNRNITRYEAAVMIARISVLLSKS